MKSRGNQTSFLEPLLGESHRTCLLPPAANYDTVFDMLSTREVLESLSAGDLYWALLMEVPPPGTSPNSSIRKARGKQVFHIIHIVIQTAQAQ